MTLPGIGASSAGALLVVLGAGDAEQVDEAQHGSGRRRTRGARRRSRRPSARQPALARAARERCRRAEGCRAVIGTPSSDDLPGAARQRADVDFAHRLAVAKAEPPQRAAVQAPAVERAPRRARIGGAIGSTARRFRIALDLGERGEQPDVRRAAAPARGNSSACSRSISAVSSSASRERRHSRPGGRGSRRCWRRRRSGTARAPAACAPARWRGRRRRRSAWRSSGRRTA